MGEENKIERGGGRGESELKKTAKLKRGGEASVMQKTSLFRTITRHLELCLPVTRSREREKHTERNKRDERKFVKEGFSE